MESSEAKDRAALEKEAKLLHNLCHENILKVTVLLLDGQVVAGFAMEALAPSLQALSQKKTLTRLGLARSLAPTCAALRFHPQEPGGSHGCLLLQWVNFSFFGGFSY